MKEGVGFKVLIKLSIVDDTGECTGVGSLGANGRVDGVGANDRVDGVGVIGVVGRALILEMRGVKPDGGSVVGWMLVRGRVGFGVGGGSGTRRRLSSCLRREISLTNAASLVFS